MKKSVMMRCKGVRNRLLCIDCYNKKPHKKDDDCGYCSVSPQGCRSCVPIIPVTPKPKKPSDKVFPIVVRLVLIKKQFESDFKSGGYGDSFRSRFITAINQAITEAEDYVESKSAMKASKR
jgi:hypothetical protein